MPYMRKLTRNGTRIAKNLQQWSSKCRPYLVSAVSGGQWPQARKAKIHACIRINTCQLCHEAVGTAEHGHACKITTPTDGWTKPPRNAKQFLDNLSPDRYSTLRDRAILTVEVPIPAPQIETGGWKWITHPPPTCDTGAHLDY